MPPAVPSSPLLLLLVFRLLLLLFPLLLLLLPLLLLLLALLLLLLDSERELDLFLERDLLAGLLDLGREVQGGAIVIVRLPQSEWMSSLG